MSVFVFAGAAQLAAIPLISAGASVAIVVLTVLMINLRLTLYSASLAPHFRRLPVGWKGLLSYLLTDQAYAATITRFDDAETKEPDKRWYFLGVALAIWVTWQAATMLGVFLGAWASEGWSLNFVLPLIFIALAVPAIKDRTTTAAAISAGLAAVFCRRLAPEPRSDHRRARRRPWWVGSGDRGRKEAAMSTLTLWLDGGWGRRRHLRAAPLLHRAAGDGWRYPSSLGRALRFVPAAVLTAVVIPLFFYENGALEVSLGNERLLAGLVAALIAWRTRSVSVHPQRGHGGAVGVAVHRTEPLMDARQGHQQRLTATPWRPPVRPLAGTSLDSRRAGAPATAAR